MTHFRSAAIAAVLFLLLTVAPATAQIPDTFTNLQVLPEDIAKEDLVGMMRDFTFALGMRCTDCHVNNGTSFSDTDFAADDKPMKEKARFMMRMLSELNQETLAGLPGRTEPPVVMTCKTCHRGQAKPYLLSQELFMAAHDRGAEGAVARYRELRTNYEISGAFDFGERETLEVVSDLVEEGMVAEALALSQLNTEFHPESTDSWAQVGVLNAELGNRAEAIAAFEHVLELNPRARGIQERIDALKE